MSEGHYFTISCFLAHHSDPIVSGQFVQSVVVREKNDGVESESVAREYVTEL